MAYGYARSHGSEPDPRDVVEAAARAAGMSVQQWLDRALAERAADDEHDGRRSRRPRNPRRRSSRDFSDGDFDEPSFRQERSAARADSLSEDRVARILGDALETMQETLRANEERTASALESLERRMAPDRDGENRVRSMMSDLEQGLRRPSQDLAAPGPAPAPVPAGQPQVVQTPVAFAPMPAPGTVPDFSLVRQLEARISSVVNLIEERAKADSPAARPRDHAEPAPPEATRAIERQIAVLGERIEALTAQTRAEPPASPEPTRAIERQIAALGERIETLTAKARAVPPPSVVDVPLSAVEQHFTALGDRLDAVADKIAGLRVSGPRDLRGQRALDSAIAEWKRLAEASATSAASDGESVIAAVRALERRLEAFDRPPQALVETFDRVQAIEQKLDAMRRTPSETAAQIERLDALERRLETMQRAPAEIAERLDDIRAIVSQPARDSMPSGIEAAIEGLSARLERIQPGATESPGFDRLHEEIQQLSRKVEAAAARPAAGIDHDTFDRIRGIETKLDAINSAPAALASRLDDIQAMVQVRPAAAPTPGLEPLLRNLALRLESIGTAPADDQALDRLHADIREISRKLEAAPASQETPGVAELGRLEQSISALFQQFDGLRADMGSAAEQAAKRAADAVLSQAAASPGVDTAEVRQQLSNIYVAQQEAERRANAMLGAVHETLKRVVDRVVDIEQDVKARFEAPMPSPAMTPPQTRAAHMMPPPAMAAHPEPAPQAMPPPPPPTETATPSAAVLRAQRFGLQTPPSPEEPAARSTFGSVLAAARGAVSGLTAGRSAAKPEPSLQPESSQGTSDLASSDAVMQADPALDLPLEPGSGRPLPGMRSVPVAMPVIDPKDPKAQFLAAARRAAQAAAEQSEAALAERAAPSGPGKASAKKGLARKQMILLGLAAAVVAVGATVQVMQSPAKVDAAPEKLSALDKGAARVAPAPQRQILPTGPVEPQSTLPAQEPATVGSISPEPKSQTPDPGLARQPLPAPTSDPLLRFEGVVGSDRLKAAARAGDPSAFIELGNRHLEGRGAPRDPKAAALWFERAADFGSAPAQFRLGAMYREGRGVERDPKLAMKYFLTAAEAGNARAMYNAAVLMAEGVNGSPNYEAAGSWFKKAAEFGIRDAQYNLAILYARGLGVPQDLMAAYAWFSAAAASGDEDAGKKRDEVAGRLAADKLAQAKAAAAAWRPKTPEAGANEVSVPVGGWDAGAAKQVPAAALPARRI